MTREEAKIMEPIMKAFIEGKPIECRTKTWEYNKGWQYSTNWRKTEQLIFRDTFEYRIKTEPKYRPFENKEECWEEMLKHQPFGWIKSKGKGYFHLIGLVQWASELEDVMITFATSEQLARSSRSLFEDYIFADGTPFGIKEE